MAERFQPYHVPQQSRRDKLRVLNAPLAPLYDPSLMSHDFPTLRHAYNFSPNSDSIVKEEGGMNFTGFVNHMFVDPAMSVHLNPNSVHDTNPYVYLNSGQSLSLSLNLQRFDDDSGIFGNSISNCGNSGSGSAPVELTNSSVPLGPFTGYASVLKGSRFLKPAQQLLEELCDVGRGIYSDINASDSGLLDPSSLGGLDDSVNCSEQTRKKSKLLLMLEEVYKRYKQYYQQIQTAVAAFESVAGLSNAAPFANLALRAMSKHFRCLKNAITDQLQFTSKSHGKISSSEREETHRPENSGRATYGQRQFQPGFVDQPVWRPQRGLPDRAVTVLRAWLFDHFLHPYPTDSDKLTLAKQTGLTRNQVSNWFINARVRLWKPMVEEVHMLETRQGQKTSQRDDQRPNDSIECENASTAVQRKGDFPFKRTRENPGDAGNTKLQYNPFGTGGGVSLTLGLHQNGVGLSDSYPINAARRFGLNSQEDQGYVRSAFVAQNLTHY